MRKYYVELRDKTGALCFSCIAPWFCLDAILDSAIMIGKSETLDHGDDAKFTMTWGVSE